MDDPKSKPSRPTSRSAKDIGPILRGWDYEPGTINVRKIRGLDGRMKLQMRIDLGILQMELTGRPDGATPHNHESLLDYFEAQLQEHRELNHSDIGFHLSPEQCQSLREEAAMYYHRYVSLFVLEEYADVARDTERNLRVMDFCRKFAAEEPDQMLLEQYRPYLVMMNTRARASVALREKKFREALEIVRQGLLRIETFFEEYNHAELFNKANEVRILKTFAREIRSQMPVDPIRQLKNKLQKAIKAERYEDAAKLRDELAKKGHAPGTVTSK